MIPKIIHYCWLSNDPFPDSIQMCIDSWKEHLPDYELILWNYERFPRGKSIWVDQAFDNHKYAFAADYIRLYALYHYGGIYLDSDVEVLRPFDELLGLPYFIGQEKTPSGIEAATLGFPPRSHFIKDLIDRYENRLFVKADGSYDEEPLPSIIRRYIASRYNYHVITSIEDFVYENDTINVFTPEYFSPKHYASKEMEVTPQTYSIHHFSSSWVAQQSTNNQIVAQSTRRSVILGSMKKLLLLRKNIVIISSNQIISIIFHAFRTDYIRPFLKGNVSDDALFCLLEKPEILKKDNIEFIKPSESKHKETIQDFYPIARMKNHSIEIHFCNHISREDVISDWNSLCDMEKEKRVVRIFPSSKPISKYKVFIIAMMINFGLTKISC